MENSMLSAASGPFVDCHASETAFARDDLCNSWKLEFCLEIALAETKIRRAASWTKRERGLQPTQLYFALFSLRTYVERIVRWFSKGPIILRFYYTRYIHTRVRIPFPFSMLHALSQTQTQVLQIIRYLIYDGLLYTVINSVGQFFSVIANLKRDIYV